MEGLLTERNELGEVVHTAMRKVWDTDLSGVVWNLIGHVVSKENKVWGIILDLIYEKIKLEKALGPSVIRVRKIRWHERISTAAREKDIDLSQVAVALSIALGMMDKDDWECALAYVQWGEKETEKDGG